MKVLDLHGTKLHQVSVKVEDFILENQYHLPLKIITGNSTRMKVLCFEVIERHDFGYFVPSDNLGQIVVLTN